MFGTCLEHVWDMFGTCLVGGGAGGEAKTQSVVMDLTSGRRTKAVVVMDSGHIVLAAITPETIAGRLGTRRRNDLKVVNLDEEESGEL